MLCSDAVVFDMSEFKLKTAVKKRWVKALRSGEYAQGECALRRRTADGEEFCCLGVLADVTGERWQKPKSGLIYKINRSPAYLPRRILPRDIQQTLAAFNDGVKEKMSFKRIANWIEKSL